MVAAQAAKEAEQEEQLTGLRKAAVLLVTMGHTASSAVLKHFNEDEVHVLGREVARLQQVANETGERVLEEFYQMSVTHDYVLKGGVEYAREMLVSAVTQKARRSLSGCAKISACANSTVPAM